MEHTFFSSKGNRILGALTLVMVILTLASVIILNLNRAEQTEYPATITVEGTGEVVAIPDIATFSFAVEAEAETADEAQGESAESINGIISYLEESGVAENDIETTSYNLYPRYTFTERICPAGSFCPPGERVQDGFTVSQRVSVKVRDTEQAGALISGVGERGATNISSLDFTIDDTEALEAEARSEAIANARAEAETLAEDLGVQIVKLTSYYENAPTRGMDSRFMAVEEASFDVPTPNLPAGEEKTMVTVNVTYEVR